VFRIALSSTTIVMTA